MTARLPDALIASPEEYLKDMPVGATCYILFTDLLVDDNRQCFLNPMAIRYSASFNKIKVHRDADGYHVFIDDADIRYTPRRLKTTFDKLPVASITQGDKPLQPGTV
jgi:hypothetical protein